MYKAGKIAQATEQRQLIRRFRQLEPLVFKKCMGKGPKDPYLAVVSLNALAKGYASIARIKKLDGRKKEAGEMAQAAAYYFSRLHTLGKLFNSMKLQKYAITREHECMNLIEECMPKAPRTANGVNYSAI